MKRVFEEMKSLGVNYAIADIVDIHVKNMKSPETGNEVPNQFSIDIIFEGNRRVLIFQSYQSIIALVVEAIGHEPIVWLGSMHDYSNTTIKYRNKFLGSMGLPGNSKDIKKAIKDGDIKT